MVKRYLSEGAKKGEKDSLPKSFNTLKKRREFLFLRNKGKSFKGKCFIINFLKSENSEIRVGLTVSKKIGNSVTRNYVKRLIRSIIRNNLDVIPSDLNLEIIPKKKIENKKFLELEHDFLMFIKNLEI